MRLIVIIILLWMLNHAVSAEEQFALIKRIVDGDTVIIDTMYAMQNGVANIPESARLAHIDAPEKDQRFGGFATTMLSRKCQGGYAFVSYKGKGRFDRNLAVLTCGGNVNLWLVTIGAAHPYSGAPKEYFAAAIQAIKNKRGLWQDNLIIHPKEWRDAKKQGRKPKALPRKSYLERYK